MIIVNNFLVLCACVSYGEAWNVGTLWTPSFRRPADTFFETASRPSTFRSTVLRYRYEDDENVEKLMKEGRGVRSMLRRRRLARLKKRVRKRAIRKKLRENQNDKDSIMTASYRSTDFAENMAEDLEQADLRLESAGLIVEPKIKPKAVVKNVHELRTALLDEGISLEDVEFDTTLIKTSASGKGNIAPILEKDKDESPFDHQVLELIKKRAQTKSKPGSRAAYDTAQLALSIEGGGMRGAVSAGMAAAIAALGLFDSFDSIYGSSAGSVVGAYMVSRQMCVDVYTEVLTAAKTKFVSKGRLLSYIARGMLDQAVNETVFTKDVNPAMNISYVLDSIMDPESGVRPLDMEHFHTNDKLQPLRIVASTVRDGAMEVSCLGSKEKDFFHNFAGVDDCTVQNHVTRNVDRKRDGLFACLQTSMTVPAACGPPLHLLRNQDAKANITSCCFDAFCFEPIPYRSAVEEGATHVLALRTRPHGVAIQTKPGFFEKTVAPNYFESHELPKVGEFFKKGGQQYIYAEDYLTLDEGLNAGASGTLVPPPKLLYAYDKEELHSRDRSNWKRAHLLPIVVGQGNTEHPVLSVDRDEVLHAVRQGFSSAFDMLAPISGIDFEEHLTGERVAQLVFSSSIPPVEDVLKQQVRFSGDTIHDDYLHQTDRDDQSSPQYEKGSREELEQLLMIQEQESARIIEDVIHKVEDTNDAIELLNLLPGFRAGKLECLSQGLHDQVNKL